MRILILSDCIDYVPLVTTLFPIPGSREKFKRFGRGISAGQGKTCGRGMRGQKSRSGEGRGTRPGFEGGQTPLYRRIPKIVGKPQKNSVKTEFALISLEMLNKLPSDAAVSVESLFTEGILTKQKRDLYKVVGGTELTVTGLTVHAHAFTESAKQAIEGANGKCILLSRTTNQPLPVN